MNQTDAKTSMLLKQHLSDHAFMQVRNQELLRATSIVLVTIVFWMTHSVSHAQPPDDASRVILHSGRTSQPIPRRRMLFLGLSAQKYPHPNVYPSLGYPHSDVMLTKATLEQQQGNYYNLSAHNSFHMRDDEITNAAIDSRIDQLKKIITGPNVHGQSDLLVIYITGHGVVVRSPQGSEFYFVTTDPGIKTDGDSDFPRQERENQLRKYAISWASLYRLVDLPCTKLIILDTCHSGAVGGSLVDKNSIRSLSRGDTFVITATGDNEKSWEGGPFKASVFAYCLAEGLKGAADGDAWSGGKHAPDQVVDLLELAAYLRKQVPIAAERLSGLRQNPRFIPGIFDAKFQIPLVRVEKTQLKANSP